MPQLRFSVMSLLRAEPKDSSPWSSLVAALFNEVHSVAAFMAGIKLALLLREPLSVRVEKDPRGRVRLYWVKRDAKKPARVDIDEEEFVRIADILPESEVLLARSGLTPGVEAALFKRGFRREIEGQTSGFWYSEASQVPAEMPRTFPTGALLRRRGQKTLDGYCMDLVQVDYVWYPLSEAGVYSYGHSAALVQGHKQVFVPVHSDANRWPRLYRAQLAEYVKPSEIEKLFGAGAAERAREKYPSVQLRLSQNQ